MPLIHTFGFQVFRPTEINELPHIDFASHRLNSDDHFQVNMVPMLSVKMETEVKVQPPPAALL